MSDQHEGDHLYGKARSPLTRIADQPRPWTVSPMNTDTQSPSAQVSEQVARYIANYTPTLPAQQWTVIGATARDLVIATAPPSRNDARVCLSHTSRFLVWVLQRAGTLDIVTVITTEWIERYCRTNPHQLGAGTLAKQREILRRLLRAIEGHSSCTRRQPRGEGPAPYAASELASLQAAAAPEGPLASILETVSGRGALKAAPIGNLDAARREAAPTDVQVRFDRLRATSIVNTLERWGTTHAAIASGGLTQTALDRILPHLPRPSESDVQALLRG
ncbi:hypothetical protein GCM10009867_19870 [Pedococcus aerophilus]|uniref:Site-specific integrase n=1 Tax=Pedococcus aerophilus TaxID=436356 RepID=A0ABN3UNU6_9MICO